MLRSLVIILLFFASSCSSFSPIDRYGRMVANIADRNHCAELVRQILEGSDDGSNKQARELLQATDSYDEFILALGKLGQESDQDWLRRALKKNQNILEMGLTDDEFSEILEIILKHSNKPDVFKAKLDELLHGMDQSLKIMKERNQCATGSCWIQTGSAVVEMGIRAEGGSEVVMSDIYLFAQHLQTQIMHNLVRPSRQIHKKGRAIKEGGAFHQIFQYLNGKGMIPDDSWKPAQDIYDKEVKSRFYTEVNEVMDDFFAKKAELDKASDEYKEMKKEVQKKLRAIFKEYIDIPKKIEFQGKEYTPEEWAEEFINPKKRAIYRYLRDVNEMSPEQQANNKADKALIMRKGTKLEEVAVEDNIVDQKQFESLIMDRIDKGKPVYLSFNSAGKSDVSYKVVTNRGEVDIPYRNINSRLMTYNSQQIGEVPYNGDHAVLITGYKKDLEGRITRLEVYNSQRLSAGRFTMTREFFRRFANQIQVFD